MSDAIRYDRLDDTEGQTLAIGRAVLDAVRRHALLGQPVCGLENGKVVWYSPAETLARIAETEAEVTVPRPTD
jgi:hypothetical protein